MNRAASNRRLVRLGALFLIAWFSVWAPAAAMDRPANETVRLAALGKVWGLLKYYHPGVAGGTTDWDSVLVEAIPEAIGAEDPAAFESVVRRVIRAAGGATPLDFPGMIPHDAADEAGFEWLNDSALFSWIVRFQLQSIKQYHTALPNRYAVFLGGMGNVSFQNELPYDGMTHPSEEYRLLALFRYWNAIRYYFPARPLIGEDWDDVLPEFVPQFRAASTAEEYNLAVRRLSARIHDTHAYMDSPVLDGLWGTLMPPFFSYTLENRMVVTYVYDSLLPFPGAVRPGDVVLSIDGVPVTGRRESLEPFLAGSTPAAVELRANYYLLLGKDDAMSLVLERGGATVAVTVSRFSQTVLSQADQAVDWGPAWKRLDGNVGYVDLTRLAEAEAAGAMEGLRDTRAIVFDLRGMPEAVLGTLGAALNPDVRIFAWYIWPDREHPGSFVGAPGLEIGPAMGNPDYYRGKVVILVDEWTHSRGEYTAMGLQASPDALVVGSQTSGANGDVSTLALPGGITTGFTGISLFYPDGRGTQRIGVVADVPVVRTIRGVCEGRDEILEAALSWIAAHVP